MYKLHEHIMQFSVQSTIFSEFLTVIVGPVDIMHLSKNTQNYAFLLTDHIHFQARQSLSVLCS